MARRSNKRLGHEVLCRLPASDQLKISMEEVADHMQEAVRETRYLMWLREQFGDALYLRVLAEATKLRAAFAEWIVHAKIINKANREKKDSERDEESIASLPIFGGRDG